jgi:hypothetical protein
MARGVVRPEADDQDGDKRDQEEGAQPDDAGQDEERPAEAHATRTT